MPFSAIGTHYRAVCDDKDIIARSMKEGASETEERQAKAIIKSLGIKGKARADDRFIIEDSDDMYATREQKEEAFRVYSEMHITAKKFLFRAGLYPVLGLLGLGLLGLGGMALTDDTAGAGDGG